jgi:hypothetical protein
MGDTGVWVFKVEHFTRYGLDEEEASDSIQIDPEYLKQLDKVKALPQAKPSKAKDKTKKHVTFMEQTEQEDMSVSEGEDDLPPARFLNHPLDDPGMSAESAAEEEGSSFENDFASSGLDSSVEYASGFQQPMSARRSLFDAVPMEPQQQLPSEPIGHYFHSTPVARVTNKVYKKAPAKRELMAHVEEAEEEQSVRTSMTKQSTTTGAPST